MCNFYHTCPVCNGFRKVKPLYSTQNKPEFICSACSGKGIITINTKEDKKKMIDNNKNLLSIDPLTKPEFIDLVFIDSC